MAQGNDHTGLEEQRDPFTFISALIFVCLFMGLANGFFELAARQEDAGISMKVFGVLSLYFMPGLLCGFAWHKVGILLGGGVGAVVRLLSLINLRILRVPTEEMPHWLLLVLACAGAGFVAGLLGCVISTTPFSERRWFRWLRKVAVGLMTAGFVLAGGIALVGFVPWGGALHTEEKLARLEDWIPVADRPLLIVIWAGLGLTALCLLLGVAALRGSPEQSQ